MHSREREDDDDEGRGRTTARTHPPSTGGKEGSRTGKKKHAKNHKRKLRKETPSYHGGVDEVTRQRIEDRKKKQPGHNRGIESLNEKRHGRGGKGRAV